jgi:CubicO group peptidase (beta-lactamase class C family)
MRNQLKDGPAVSQRPAPLRISPRRHRSDSEYSNFGFQILGLALERATRTPFDTLLNRRICTPLAMKHTGIDRAGDATSRQGHRARRIRPD